MGNIGSPRREIIVVPEGEPITIPESEPMKEPNIPIPQEEPAQA